MCGLAGFLVEADCHDRAAIWPSLLRDMGWALRHRGPDDEGIWFDTSAGVGLTHRRLAILDLSPAGHQPMTSPSGRYVVAFNGEIYNHLEIRRDIEAQGSAPPPAAGANTSAVSSGWRGHSDTETLLAAFDRWGIAASLPRAVGMFAMAVWDRSRRTLTLARDRMGEKPLYYGWQGRAFLFASELKALRKHGAFRPEIDRNALAEYLRHGCIAAPGSIYRGMFKLLPGTILEVSLGSQEARPQAYWSPPPAASAMPDMDETACIVELERLLGAAVAGQMLADVPLGAFLSGGIDSSIILALMQQCSPRPVKSFTIGFARRAFDEADHAREVAAFLGTEHTEFYVTPGEVQAVIPHLASIYDEPFADSSQIPTCLVSELARRQVTVCLSGDGGDELFGGYTRYLWTAKALAQAAHLPKGLRRSIGRVLAMASPSVLERLFTLGRHVLPAAWRYSNAGDKLHKLSDILTARSSGEAIDDVLAFWKRTDRLVVGHAASQDTADAEAGFRGPDEVTIEMMRRDLGNYLPDDILVKVDRAAMAASLETRVPLLDHRVVEFALRLPLSLKVRDGQGKWLLRQLLARHLPKKLFERPKAGFVVPLDEWLRGELRDWAEELLDPLRLAREGWLEPGPVRASWQEHIDGRRNRAGRLWSILMFQCWTECHHRTSA